MGYLALQGVFWIGKELMSGDDDPIINEEIKDSEEKAIRQQEKENQKPMENLKKKPKDYSDDEHRQHDQDDTLKYKDVDSREAKREESLKSRHDEEMSAKMAMEKEDRKRKEEEAEAARKLEMEEVLRKAEALAKKEAESKAEAEKKEAALKLEQQLRKEEELRHKMEMEHQEKLRKEEEEKMKRLQEEEDARRLADAKKQAELKVELEKLQKQIMEKQKEKVPENEAVPHNSSEDHAYDEHYKYSIDVDGKGQLIHGRHFAMKASKTEHEIEEEAERHMRLNFPDDHFPVIVTAATRNNLEDVEKLIESVQYFLPDKKLIIFHIDLHEEQVAKLESACNVETRIFWMWMFPAHVHNCSETSWRPVIIQLALAEFGSVMWINSNTRLVKGHFQSLLKESEEEDLVVLTSNKPYSTYSVTHPDMYGYLPTNLEMLKKTSHLEIRLVIIHNTKRIQNKLLKWLILCSLEKSCLAPTGSRHKCDPPLTKSVYANCHRYDESAMNILLKNYFGFKLTSFAREDTFTMNAADWKGIPNIKKCR